MTSEVFNYWPWNLDILACGRVEYELSLRKAWSILRDSTVAYSKIDFCFNLRKASEYCLLCVVSPQQYPQLSLVASCFYLRITFTVAKTGPTEKTDRVISTSISSKPNTVDASDKWNSFRLRYKFRYAFRAPPLTDFDVTPSRRTILCSVIHQRHIGLTLQNQQVVHLLLLIVGRTWLDFRIIFQSCLLTINVYVSSHTLSAVKV